MAIPQLRVLHRDQSRDDAGGVFAESARGRQHRGRKAYIRRIRNFAPAMEQIIASIDTAAALGIVPTAFSFDPVLGDARNMLKGFPFEATTNDGALMADFRTKVSALKLDDAQQKQLLDSATEAIKGPFQSAIMHFIARVEALRPQSHGAQGVWNLPEGDAYYRYTVKWWTTDATLTPERIHRLGLAEVKRIRREMQSVMRRTGFKGTLHEFFDYLRTDAGNFYPDTDAGRQAYLDQSKAYIDAVYKDADR